MPIALTFTEGGLPKGSEKEAGKRITEAFLKWHGLTGNKIMTPNVTNHINVLPKGSTLSGGEPFVGAWNMDGRAMTNEQLGEAISKG